MMTSGTSSGTGQSYAEAEAPKKKRKKKIVEQKAPSEGFEIEGLLFGFPPYLIREHKDCIQYFFKFDNDYGASIVVYSEEGDTGTWELLKIKIIKDKPIELDLEHEEWYEKRGNNIEEIREGLIEISEWAKTAPPANSKKKKVKK
jgi:hypothetical protein